MTESQAFAVGQYIWYDDAITDCYSPERGKIVGGQPGAWHVLSGGIKIILPERRLHHKRPTRRADQR
jgi:hypothetical protein